MEAAASLRGFPVTLPSRSVAHLHPFSFPQPLLSARSRYLLLNTLLCRLPSRTHHSTSLTAAAAAALYGRDDDDDGTRFQDKEKGYEEEDEEQVSYKFGAILTAGSPSQESGRLYVGNLPFSMTPAQLAEIFGEAGTVDTVEVVYDRVTERSRGFAFVKMASVEEANEAIRMFDGSQVGSRTVKVNFPEVPRGGEREVLGPRMRSRGFVNSPHKVYTGNLGWSLTSQTLLDAFSSQPGVLGAKVIFDRDTGRSRGYGFVSFASAEECRAAIEAMNGVEVEGRPLRLSVAEGKPYSSPGFRLTKPRDRTLESSLSY